MEDLPLYNRFGWQSSLQKFSRTEPRVVRLQLQQFVADASQEQVRAWDQSIPWLQRECRELEVRDAAALQKDSPGADQEPNWLPATDGPICLVMRLYWPTAEAPSSLAAGGRDREVGGGAGGGCPARSVAESIVNRAEPLRDLHARVRDAVQRQLREGGAPKVFPLLC